MRRDCGDETKETFIDGGKCANLGELEKQAKQNEDLLTEIGFEFLDTAENQPSKFWQKIGENWQNVRFKKECIFR